MTFLPPKYVKYTIHDRLRVQREAYAGGREAQIRFVKQCAEDRTYFTAMCVDQINPRAVGEKVSPFLPYRRQHEALHFVQYCKENRRDAVWPKCRFVGMSWTHMIDDMHGWLFEDGGYLSLAGSRIDTLVDPPGGGNMDALFPKFDFIYSRLPRFMWIPEYCNLTGKGQSPFKVEMLRLNPRQGNQLAGEAVTRNFGAGGRSVKSLMDEMSRCIHAETGWGSVTQTCSSKHGVGTPQGMDYFWSLNYPEEAAMMSGRKNPERPLRFRIDWRDIDAFNEYLILDIPVQLDPSPWKTVDEFDAWLERARPNVIASAHGYAPDTPIGVDEGIPWNYGYDDSRGNIIDLPERMPIEKMPVHGVSCIHPWRIREGFRYDEVTAAQELDISWSKAKAGRVYFIQMRNAGIRERKRRVNEYPLYCGVDPGRGAGNAFFIFWVQYNKQSGRYETIRELTCEGRSGDFFIPFLTGRPEDWKYAEQEFPNWEEEEMYQEMLSPIWRPNMVIGDPAAMTTKTASSKDSIKNTWSNAGIPVYVNHNHRDFNTRIDAARRVIPRTDFCPDKTPRLIVALQQIAFPPIPENTVTVTPPTGYVHHPVFSHPAAAFEYFACYDPHKLDAPQYAENSPESRLEDLRSGSRRKDYYEPRDRSGY